MPGGKPAQLGPRDGLLIVDVQNDFFPGGALPVKGDRGVIPVLNRWIEAATTGGAAIIASRDWHPPGHSSFQGSGGPWPEHCVQGTAGAAYCPELQLPPDALVVSKGQHPDRDSYSDFEETDLADQLRASGITRLWVGGVATEYCVRATVLDAVEEGFEVHLIKDAIAPVDVEPGDGERAVDEMRNAGVVIEG